MPADLRKLVVDYLNEAKLMQIATAKNNRPWVASVWYAHDDRECSGKTLEKARNLYLKKYSGAEKIPMEKLRDPVFAAAFYAVRPRSFVLFDEVNFPNEPRQEINL